MASIRFNLNPSGTKVLIRAVFQDGDKQVFKSIGDTIPATKVNGAYKHWDKNKQLVKGLDNALRINSTIEKWRSGFAAYLDDCKRDGVPVDIRKFADTFTGDKKTVAPALYEIIDLFNKHFKDEHAAPTRNKYASIRNDVKEYQDKRKATILATDVNEAFYRDFARYMISELSNHNRTVNRKLGMIITVMEFAKRVLKLKLTDGEYKAVPTFKEVKAPKFPLYPNEIAILQAHVADTPFRVMALDAFLLACETGLRYSDIIQLHPVHIKSIPVEGGGLRYIDLTSKKTDKANNMPLSNKASAIIDKYDNGGRFFEFDYSQSVSRELKKIFKAAGLNRPCEIVKTQGNTTTKEVLPLHDVISFHMARNTYITRLLAANVAPSFVQENAGHADIATTMGYNRTHDIARWQSTVDALNK